MIRTFSLALLSLSVFGALPAMAEPKAYEPLQVTYDTTGADDAGLKTFIQSLRKAVDAGDATALKLSVSLDLKIYAPTIGFPEATTVAALANPDKHEGEQRLDEAAVLTTSSDSNYSREDLDSLIIDLFGTALEPGTIGKSATVGGALCSPAEPIFDRDKALAIAEAADVPPGNLWILSENTEFREKPDLASPVIETLPAGSIVPFIEGSVETSAAEESEDDWYSVALPSAKIGYAANDASLAFQAISVCYGKVEDNWLVTSVVVPGI